MFNFIYNYFNYSNKIINEHDPNVIVKNNDIILLKSLLIDGSANPNIQNNEGNTPLHLYNDVDIIKLLLEHGANPNIQNNNGYTPLHYHHYNVCITKLLLEKGANPNIQNKNGDTPLHYNTNINIIKLLLDYGADIHHLNINKQNVLFKHNNIYILQFYIDKDVDINQQDTYGKYAIDYIPDEYKTNEIIELLTVTKSNTKSANKYL